MFQIAPWTNTLCSYSAINCPSTDGVSSRARIVVVGWLPLNVLCGTSSSATPSARTSSGVLPNANACVCAKKLAISRSCCALSPSLSSATGSAKPMKSAGINFVPWWMSW